MESQATDDTLNTIITLPLGVIGGLLVALITVYALGYGECEPICGYIYFLINITPLMKTTLAYIHYRGTDIFALTMGVFLGIVAMLVNITSLLIIDKILG